MKGQGLSDTTERSKNGPGKFVASKIRQSSQVPILSCATLGKPSEPAPSTNTVLPISSIGLSEANKLSEKDVQVSFNLINESNLTQ